MKVSDKVIAVTNNKGVSRGEIYTIIGVHDSLLDVKCINGLYYYHLGSSNFIPVDDYHIEEEIARTKEYIDHLYAIHNSLPRIQHFKQGESFLFEGKKYTLCGEYVNSEGYIAVDDEYNLFEFDHGECVVRV